jgi:hypothetical protein
MLLRATEDVLNNWAVYIRVRLSLCLSKHYAMKTYRESGCIDPHILEEYCLLGYNAVKSGGKQSNQLAGKLSGLSQGYAPEDSTLHKHRCENLKSSYS